jgi:hypothetical protein
MVSALDRAHRTLLDQIQPTRISKEAIFYVVEMAWDGQNTMDVIINRQYKAGREARSFD